MRSLREADRPVPSGYALSLVERLPATSRRKPGEVRETYLAEGGSTFFRRRSIDGARVLAESYLSPAGGPHRLDGPAETHYERDGSVAREEWRIDGWLSRGDGAPAVRVFSLGQVVREEWWVDGKPSRLDGPAERTRGRDGRRTERWLVRGCAVRPGNVKLGLSWLSEDDVEREIRFSFYALLLEEGVPAATVAEALVGGVRTLDGVREVIAGAPPEWVASFEAGAVAA